MSNEKLDPRSLREKAEALVTFTREGPLFIAWVQAVTDALEPASKPAKVECPNCLQPEEHPHFAGNLTGDGGWYFCPGRVPQAADKRKPSQPELSGHDSARSGQPASEGGKVECPNCHHEDTGHAWKVNGELRYSCKGWNKPAQPEHLFTCRNCGKGYDCDEGEHYIFASGLYACLPPKPAQPEPVAEEMPEAVSVNTWQLEELLKYADLAEVSLRTGFHPLEFLFEPADRSLRQCIDAIKEQRDQWRVHAARPAPAVAMSPELERVLDFAWSQACETDGYTQPRVEADILAVRAQAAEAVDASAIYDKGFADGIALQKKCAAEAGKVPDCVIHAVRLRRSYLCDLPNSDYGKEQALEMRTIEDWLRAAEGRK